MAPHRALMCAMYIGANLRNTATDGILISGQGVLVKVNNDLIGLVKLFCIYSSKTSSMVSQ